MFVPYAINGFALEMADTEQEVTLFVKDEVFCGPSYIFELSNYYIIFRKNSYIHIIYF